MIAIKVGTEYLDLQGTKIRIRMPSQVFSRQFVTQGYSYPMKLAKTPTNQRAMRYYDRLANTTRYDDISCTVYLGGNPWRQAVIKYRGFKDDAYDVDIQVPEQDEVLTLKTKRIDDLDVVYSFTPPGSFAVPEVNDEWNDRLGDHTQTDFILAPIRNTGIFGDREETWYNTLAADHPEFVPADEYVNYYDADRPEEWFKYQLLLNPDRNLYEFVPMPYLVRVVEHVLGMADLTLGGDVFQKPEVLKQVVLSNLLIHVGVGTDPSNAIIFSDVSPGLYPEARLSDMLPDITAMDLLVRVCKRYNAVPLFRRGKRLDIRSRTDILSDNFYEDITAWAEPQAEIELEVNGGVTYTEKEEPGDEARPTAKYDEDRIIAVVRLTSDLASVTTAVNGDLVLVETTGRLHVRQFNEWKELADYFPSVATGDGSGSDDVGVGFVRMWSGVDTNKSGRQWLVPHVQQTLYDPYRDLHQLGQTRIEELRLLFFRGLQKDSTFDEYPLVTNDVYRYDGTEIFGAEMREALDGPRGIIQRWYANWDAVMAKAKIVSRRVRIPAYRLRNFPWDRKFRIDGHDHLIREIDVEFSTTGMGIANVEMLRLPTELSGVRQPITCAGRGHITIYFQDNIGDLIVSWITSNVDQYASYRGEDGIITTADGGDDIPGSGGGTNVICLYPSNAEGVAGGAFLFLQLIDRVQSIHLRYAAELAQLYMPFTGGLFLQEPIDLSFCTSLDTLEIPNYPFPTIDISNCTFLNSLVMPNSDLQEMDFSNSTNIGVIDLSGCDITNTDQILIDLDANAPANGTLDLTGGTNAAPTGASAAAIANLIANGWTIATN